MAIVSFQLNKMSPKGANQHRIVEIQRNLSEIFNETDSNDDMGKLWNN